MGIGAPGQAAAENVYIGIKAIVLELLKRFTAPIVLTGLFPTGWNWPAGSFAETVPRVNRLLAELAETLPINRLRVVNCSWAVLDRFGHIDKLLMPDFLHPWHKGMTNWAHCLQQVLDQVLG